MAADPPRRESLALRRLLAQRWRAFAVLASTAALGGLLEAAILVVFARVAVSIANDDAQVGLTRGFEASHSEALVLLALLVTVRALLAALAAWQTARLATSLTSAMRLTLSEAFVHSSWEVQAESQAGKLQELMTSFASQGTVLVGATARTVSVSFNLFALFAAAFVVDPPSSAVLVGAMVLLALLLRPLRRRIKQQAQKASEAGMAFATSLAELSELGVEMHVFGVQSEINHRIATLVRTHEHRQRRLRFFQGLLPALYTGLAYLAVVLALAVATQVDSGDLGSVGAVMLIMLRGLTYGQALQTSSATVNAALPFLSRLEDEANHFMESKPAEGTIAPRTVGRIKLREVDFSYVPGVPVLRGISAEFGPCEVIGVVGPSGSGKSTLVQLLLGLRAPSAGAVEVDGIDVGEMRSATWSTLSTFVPQEPRMVSGTIAENISFMRPGVTAADIERAARLANLAPEIDAWPNGYDRHIRGIDSELSGGQRQRLTVARSLVAKPSFLVLDEPTSALDVRSESLIRQTLSELRKDTTIVIIAHRLSTLDICDRIMVIQDGELKAFDTPERLAETSDFYREALELSGLR